MELNNKFEIGEEVYSLAKENLKEDCVICSGKKTVTLKTDKGDREIECFKCFGVGYSVSPHKKYVVNEEPYTVSSIKASIGKDKITLKYCLKDSNGRKVSRTESNMSKDLEALRKKCENLNYIEDVPQHLNYNKRVLKDLVDVYICGGRVLKNNLKYMYETTNEDIEGYIEDDKIVCVEDNNTCTLHTSDFSVIKKFAEILKEHFPEKRLMLGSQNILPGIIEDYE